MSTKKVEKPVVNREVFEQILVEFQEQFRKELRKTIIEKTHTADFKFVAGLKMAANLVWTEEAEPILSKSEPKKEADNG